MSSQSDPPQQPSRRDIAALLEAARTPELENSYEFSLDDIIADLRRPSRRQTRVPALVVPPRSAAAKAS
ncbi:MAG: hypothetical protein ACR2OZ_08730 [Verrucomicrobiales bacterium]